MPSGACGPPLTPEVAQVTRGSVQVKETGMYEFRPGYGGSTYNVMEVDGKVVHRQEVGKDPVRTEIKLEGGKKVPFKITYFTKQANGLGWIVRLDVPGALSTLVKFKGMYPYLIDEKRQWKTRDDAWYRGVVTATGNRPLGVAGGRIGPEIGFGHAVGNHLDEPVLILKSSQGNRSLSWDFLTPGSKRFEYKGKIYAGYKESPLSWDKGTKPEPINWYAGKQYDDCFGAAHEVLKNFDKEFPHWKGRGYEIEGFAWWQGDKDRYVEAHAVRYEKNLVRLIKTLRKEFKAPKAKFVVATLGQTAKDAQPSNDKLILDAQLAVDGATGNYPEFKGNDPPCTPIRSVRAAPPTATTTATPKPTWTSGSPWVKPWSSCSNRFDEKCKSGNRSTSLFGGDFLRSPLLGIGWLDRSYLSPSRFKLWCWMQFRGHWITCLRRSNFF